jgi:hypothetical protein
LFSAAATSEPLPLAVASFGGGGSTAAAATTTRERHHLHVLFIANHRAVQLSQTIQNTYKLSQENVPGSPAITPKHFHITALHVITQDETQSSVQSMAIPMNGVHLYFSSTSVTSPYGYYPSDTWVQCNLQLVHVHIPLSICFAKSSEVLNQA